MARQRTDAPDAGGAGRGARGAAGHERVPSQDEAQEIHGLRAAFHRALGRAAGRADRVAALKRIFISGGDDVSSPFNMQKKIINRIYFSE